MEALGHFHYHFWKLERLSYLKCFHRFFTESSQCDLKSQILKHDARFSFCIFWTFYKKKKKQNHHHPLLQWLHDLQQCFLCLHLCLCHKNSFFINFSHWLKRPSCKCCTNNPEYRCQWVFYKTLEKNGTVSKTAEGMSVYTKRPFNTRREEKNLLNIQQNPLSANNQQPHNNKIQLRVERVTANPPSPSWPEQPPEAPRGKNAPLSLQRPLRYASVLLLTSRQFNCVHMAPGQETCLKEHNCKMMTRNQSLLYSWP